MDDSLITELQRKIKIMTLRSFDPKNCAHILVLTLVHPLQRFYCFPIFPVLDVQYPVSCLVLQTTNTVLMTGTKL